MPLSPLIRPLSPLQTQCAPLLPEPYSLADVILQPFSAATSATPAGVWDEHTSSVAVGRPTAPESQHSRVAYPSAPGATNVLPVAMSTPAPPLLLTHTLAPSFHSMVGDALSSEMLRDSYAAQPKKDRQQHSVGEALRCVPTGTTVWPGSRLSTDTGATKVPAANDAVHFEHPRRTQAPNRASSSPNHPYVSGTTVRSSFAHRTPADEALRAATSSSLLHSAATTAMAAAQPSYGTALLRKRLPATQASQRERCRLHLLAQRQLQRSSSQSLSDWRVHGRAKVVSPLLTLSSCGGASTAAECTERDPNKPYPAAPLAELATCYHDTAISDSTCRPHTISMVASPVVGESSESAATNASAGGCARISHARVVTPFASSTLSPAHSEAAEKMKEEAFVALPRYSPHCACGRREGENVVEGEDGDTFFDAPYDLARKMLQALQPEPIAGPLRRPAPEKQGKTPRSLTPSTRSSGGVASAPATGSPTSLAAEPYLPRYVYPALEECRRLLHEIHLVNPLLHRCLAPPRPLGTSSGSGSGRVATAALAPSECSQAHASSSNMPVSAQSGTFPSLSAATTAVVLPKRTTLALSSEARRLYHWNSTTAAEDLSLMHGPFQQSSERFTSSMARQLQRLQAVGARLYGNTHDTSTSRDEVHGPARRRWRLPSSAPSTSSWNFVVPHFDVDQCSSEENNANESPSGQLRRLLRETEAALPSLLGREAGPPLSTTPNAAFTTLLPSTKNNARGDRDDCSHSALDGAPTTHAAGMSTPLVGNLFPFPSICDSLTPARPPMLSSSPYGA
ncbi:hypothetical protein, conserved [Leishmania lindenbergi]|uniref:Uncharacterized protein n=1 Tax=Leishmania lindenbergi TaxID=651832 RepID=A0AAW2ZTQ2_9TRYP